MEDKMTLGELIKKCRKDRKLSISEAALRMRVSSSHLHYIECGKTEKPKMETLYKIIVFYGLPVDETCKLAGRVPMDVYYKILNNPRLFATIRNMDV
jgi:transcriptional regulator with XRE-family HTH domain